MWSIHRSSQQIQSFAWSNANWRFSYFLLEYYYAPIRPFFTDYDKDRTVGVSGQQMLLTSPWHRIFCIFIEVRVCSAPLLFLFICFGFFFVLFYSLYFLFWTLFIKKSMRVVFNIFPLIPPFPFSLFNANMY